MGPCLRRGDAERDLPPRKVPRSDVESASTKEQTDEEEPFFRGADHRDDQGAGGGPADGRGVPQAWAEPGDVLQVEGQVWRHGGVRGAAAAPARGRECQAQAVAGRERAGQSCPEPAEGAMLKDLLGKVWRRQASDGTRRLV